MAISGHFDVSGKRLLKFRRLLKFSFLGYDQIFDRFLTQACQYQICVNARLENVDDEREEREFLKWHKGGGMFHKSATIDPTASIDFGAVVHSESLVAGNVRVGSGTVVGPNMTIGQSTKIGYAHLSIFKQLCSMLPMYLTIQVNTCDMWYNVALANCTIGDSCVIHNGVCIGQDGKINWTLALNFYKLMEKEVSHDNLLMIFKVIHQLVIGFGFYLDDQGAMVKKPQVSKSPFISYDTALKAHIGDNVEIGANSCIDRGRSQFVNGEGRLLVALKAHIGDNVEIGANSCIDRGRIGDYVTLGGRVGVRDHVTIASKDITKPGDYGGFPAVPIREWRRQVASRSQTVKISDYVTLGGRVGVRDHVTIASKDITKPGDYGGFPAVPIREWRRQVASRSQTVNGEG
ncbi:probable UDP-3-O-acylglucosamine N-acyltransferase 2, mitochondrial, partial [Tanacetum coccineum]